MKNRIDEIYQSHINSIEFIERAREVDVDISWLQDKLCFEDMAKLEEDISSYHINNGKAFFQSGFYFAWELFKQCQNDGKE